MVKVRSTLSALVFNVVVPAWLIVTLANASSELMVPPSTSKVTVAVPGVNSPAPALAQLLAVMLEPLEFNVPAVSVMVPSTSSASAMVTVPAELTITPLNASLPGARLVVPSNVTVPVRAVNVAPSTTVQSPPTAMAQLAAVHPAAETSSVCVLLTLKAPFTSNAASRVTVPVPESVRL